MTEPSPFRSGSSLETASPRTSRRRSRSRRGRGDESRYEPRGLDRSPRVDVPETVALPVLVVLTIVLALILAAAAPAAGQEDDGVRRYVRYADASGAVSYGLLEDGTVRELEGDLFGNRPTGRTHALDAVTLLTPVDPLATGKVVGTAVNTRRPGLELPPDAHPRWFAKFPTSLNAHGAGVELPPEAGNLNYEGELVVIVGRKAKNVSEETALDYVFGYAVGNDFSENTWYGERAGREEPTRMISKGSDSWAVIGPAVVTGLDHRGRRVETRLNGELVQEGSTDDLIQDVPELISYLSRYVTLLPGDVVYTGTVPFVEGARRRMEVGDELVVTIEGLGELRNTIVPWEERSTDRHPGVGADVTGAGKKLRRPEGGSSAASGQVTAYGAVHGWPALPPGYRMGEASGLGVSSRGEVYLFHRADRHWLRPEGTIPRPTIAVFDARSGALLRELGAGMFANAHGLEIDHQDNIWVTDNGLHQVVKLSPEGEVLLVVGEPGVRGEDETHLSGPTDVAVAPDGSFWVSDGYGNNRIVKYDAEGNFLLQVGGERGSEPGRFDLPHGITMDDDGRVYVADRTNARIQVFDAGGTFLAEWTHWQSDDLGRPWGLEYDDGSVYVADGGEYWLSSQYASGEPTLPRDRAHLQRLDLDGNLLESWGRYGRYDGEMIWPHDVTVDADGGVYSAEIRGYRIQKWVRGGGSVGR